MSAGGVLHVITGLHTGGAEGQLAALAMHNHAAGRDVTVVSLTPGGAHRESLAAAGVPVFDLGMRRGRPSLSALSRLAALIRRVQPAAVQQALCSDKRRITKQKTDSAGVAWQSLGDP